MIVKNIFMRAVKNDGGGRSSGTVIGILAIARPGTTRDEPGAGGSSGIPSDIIEIS